MTNANLDGMRVDQETWAQQLKDAMNVNGGDVENATAGDYVMHFLTFGFKVCRVLLTMCDFHNFGLIFTGQCTVCLKG